jgi:hypothetical protein
LIDELECVELGTLPECKIEDPASEELDERKVCAALDEEDVDNVETKLAVASDEGNEGVVEDKPEVDTGSVVVLVVI